MRVTIPFAEGATHHACSSCAFLLLIPLRFVLHPQECHFRDSNALP